MRSGLPKLGVFLAYWPWTSPDEQRTLAVLADRGGIDSLWIAEAWGQEAPSTLGWLAGLTRNIGLGSAVMQIPARPATTTSMAAATIDVLSGGRFRLGLGVSGPQVSENWYGVPFGGSLARSRDYVETVRAALAGESITIDGRGRRIDDPDAPQIKLLAKPHQDRVPIYMGALGPRSIDQTYELADGWVPFLIGTDMLAERPRPERAFDISPIVPLAVADTLDEARDQVRPWLAFYFGAMGTAKKHFLVELAEREGHPSARDVQRRYLAGDRSGAAAALDTRLIDASAVATTPDRLADRLGQIHAAGADSILAAVLGDRTRAVKELVSLADR